MGHRQSVPVLLSGHRLQVTTKIGGPMIASCASNLLLAVIICILVNRINPVIQDVVRIPQEQGILRRQTEHLNEDDIWAISEQIADQIENKGQIDEVSISNLILIFHGKVKSEFEKGYTGVEFLGAKETYTREKKALTSLDLDEVFNSEGENVILKNYPDTERILEITNSILKS